MQPTEVTAILNIIREYGLPLVMLIFVVWYLLKTDKRHRSERENWTTTSNKQFDELHKMQKLHTKQYSTALNKNTRVLSEIKTLIQSTSKQKSK